MNLSLRILLCGSLVAYAGTSLYAMEAEFAENQQLQTEQTHPAYSKDLWNNMMQALPVDVAMNVVVQQFDPGTRIAMAKVLQSNLKDKIEDSDRRSGVIKALTKTIQTTNQDLIFVFQRESEYLATQPMYAPVMYYQVKNKSEKKITVQVGDIPEVSLAPGQCYQAPLEVITWGGRDQGIYVPVLQANFFIKLNGGHKMWVPCFYSKSHSFPRLPEGSFWLTPYDQRLQIAPWWTDRCDNSVKRSLNQTDFYRLTLIVGDNKGLEHELELIS